MKKMLITVLILIGVLIFSTVAYAADTATKISLDDRAHFTVELKSKTLVFSGEPKAKTVDTTIDNIHIVIADIKSREIFRDVTYNRGQIDGATIDLNGLSDGSYGLGFSYKQVYTDNRWSFINSKLNITIEIKGGSASFKLSDFYANNLKATANERTDAYALDFLKANLENTKADFQSSVYSNVNLKSKVDVLTDEYESCKSSDAAYTKQANIITAGITDDYAKVRAIHDWVSSNMYYDDYIYSGMTGPMCEDANTEVFPGSGFYKRGICDDFANLATGLFRAAGFPAKYVKGQAIGGFFNKLELHAWTEVYVDNRWVFVDTTWDCVNDFDGKFSDKVPCNDTYFDMPIVRWSVDHKLDSYSISDLDNNAWYGSLYIVDMSTNKVLKEIKNYPLGSLVTSTYGYNANDMYSDAKCTRHWNFATDKVSSYNSRIYIKAYTISIYWQDLAMNIFTVQVNSKLVKPETPIRKGYKFVNWYKDSKRTKVWNFATDKVTADTNLYAGWKKN